MARSLPALIGAAGVAALCPAAADAHSLVRTGGNEIAYLSSDAVSLNTLVVKRSGANVDFRDPTVDGGLDVGPCAPGDITDDANSWVIQALCPAAGAGRLRIDLGDREDSAVVQLDLPVTLLGGTGADKLTTAGGADAVAGDDGDDVIRCRRRQRPGQRRRRGRRRRQRRGQRHRRGGSRRRHGLRRRGQRRPARARRDRRHRLLRRRRGQGRRRHARRRRARLRERLAAADAGARRAAAPPAATAPPRRSASAARPSSAPVAVASRSSRPRASAARSPPRASSTSPDSRCRSARTARLVGVGGGGVELTVKLTARARREAARAWRRGRRVRARMGVVGIDRAGNSARVQAPAIRLLR